TVKAQHLIVYLIFYSYVAGLCENIISGFSYKSRGAVKGDWEALPVGDRHQTLEKESVSSL
ncbi:hypothetical protein, partial [Cylindrospermopsis raciborskii]|uniref:hypothetical protein n=1 Tax=Cylindrospermopsis raciborskii TaxID=77022 RepID=UPI000CBD0DA9